MSGRRRLSAALAAAFPLAALAAGTSSAAVGKPRATGPSARTDTSMAVDFNTNVVLFGGYSDSADQFLSDTWTWDGATWTEQHPTTSPSPRCCFDLTYDAARGQVVLFGGTDNFNIFNDTWTWDGNDWTLQHPVRSPPTAVGYGMAYDAATRTTLMFLGAGLVLQPIWSWDGVNWTELHPATVPGWREWMGSAYDGVRRKIVMYGGENCAEICSFLRDTWTWDGNNWTRQNPARNPGPRSRMGMAYDAARQRVLLFGGVFNGMGYAGDTWQWDGHAWTEVAPNASPSAREEPAMAWDRTRRQIVLFGGNDQFGGSYRDFGDTWVWDGFNWTCKAGCT